MLVISSREFRDKQAQYMDRADKGEQIIVQRGRDKAYAITPVKSSDIYKYTGIVRRLCIRRTNQKTSTSTH